MFQYGIIEDDGDSGVALPAANCPACGSPADFDGYVKKRVSYMFRCNACGLDFGVARIEPEISDPAVNPGDEPSCPGCGARPRFMGRRGSTDVYYCPDDRCPFILFDAVDDRSAKCSDRLIRSAQEKGRAGVAPSSGRMMHLPGDEHHASTAV